MTTFKSHNFLVWFNVAEEGKVKCKLCNKILMSNRLYNLKQHLKLSHQLEFRPTKRVCKKKHRFVSSNETASSSFKIAEQYSLQNKTSDTGDSFCDISTGTFVSVDSLSGDSCSIAATGLHTIKIEEERIQEVRVPECPQAVGHETTIDVNSGDDNNAETTSTQNLSNQPFIEAAPRSWKNIRGFKEPIILTNIDDINQGSKKKKSTALPDDPLDENTSSSKNDSFEQWVNKKKQFLELEVLEIRNYKMKLELWEKEQQLNVKCSKFTRGIEKRHQ